MWHGRTFRSVIGCDPEGVALIITKQELADLCGVSQRTVQRWYKAKVVPTDTADFLVWLLDKVDAKTN